MKGILIYGMLVLCAAVISACNDTENAGPDTDDTASGATDDDSDTGTDADTDTDTDADTDVDTDTDTDVDTDTDTDVDTDTDTDVDTDTDTDVDTDTDTDVDTDTDTDVDTDTDTDVDTDVDGGDDTDADGGTDTDVDAGWAPTRCNNPVSPDCCGFDLFSDSYKDTIDLGMCPNNQSVYGDACSLEECTICVWEFQAGNRDCGYEQYICLAGKWELWGHFDQALSCYGDADGGLGAGTAGGN